MAPRTQVKTILFDLDGTLLDTAPDLTNALNQLLVRRGKAPVSVDKVRQEISRGSPGMLNLAFSITKTDPDFHSLRREFLSEYANNISAETSFFPGMDNVLKTLQGMDITWGIVTNKPHDLAEQLMSELGLLEQCVCMVGASDERKSKPDPELLIFACNQINTDPTHCVFVGDSQADIEAAKTINMPSIAAMYGYIGKHDKPEAWAADYYIDKPMEIIDWLMRR